MRIKNILYRSKITDAKKIPIIINNRNRFSTLKNLIEFVEKRGCHNIYIIDNASTYPPLLEYYKGISHKVFYLKENTGYLAIWKSGIYKQFYKDFYVYTDSDVLPIEECPDDFMSFFRETLMNYRDVQKVGFSLKIDDLPDHYAKKDLVIKWEQQFYQKTVSELLYEANIDTTFALYRPGAKGGASKLKMYRTAYPYQARHMPWYANTDNLDDEEKYYIEHAKIGTHWTKMFKS